MFFDQFMNADQLVKFGPGVKLPNTSFKADRLVLKGELMDAVEKVIRRDTTTQFSAFETAAFNLSRKLNESAGPGGKSERDFLSLFG